MEKSDSASGKAIQVHTAAVLNDDRASWANNDIGLDRTFRRLDSTRHQDLPTIYSSIDHLAGGVATQRFPLHMLVALDRDDDEWLGFGRP